MKKLLTSIAVALLIAACGKPNDDQVFKLNIEKTEFLVNGTNPIEIPYTVDGATANTVVGVSGYDPDMFCVSVEPDKIVVIPLINWAAGDMLAYADSRTGKVSLVNLCFERETLTALYNPYSTDIDFMVERTGGYLEIPLITSLDLSIDCTDSWIHYVETKSHKSTIVLSIDENPKTSVRTGGVNLLRTGQADNLLMTVIIAQKGQ